MKTTYIKIFVLLTILSGLNSCSGWLDNQPEGKIVLEDYWKSESDVDAMVATCYQSLIEGPKKVNDHLVLGFVQSAIIYGEVRSDNVTPSVVSSSSDVGKVEEANILPNNMFSNWSRFYNTINYCNLLLYWAPQVIDPNFTSAELHARESEVLAIRSLCYFYLVRAYKNVPLILTPSSSDAQNYQVPQSTEDVVLDQIEKDLLSAETMAVASYSNIKYNKGRFTKMSIRALLADVYLWRNKYTECVTYCDKIIAEPTLKIVEPDMFPYTKIFGIKNSTESIFELQYEMFNGLSNDAINSYYGGLEQKFGIYSVSEFICKKDMKEVFDNTTTLTDVRRKDFIAGTDIQKGYAIFKYAGQSRSENTDGSSTWYYRDIMNSPNWIIYRLTDIMLMKAEALVELDRNETDRKVAVHMVNVVHMRSNPTLLPTDTVKFDAQTAKAEMQERVLLERQKELMFEGKRWFDLVRVARREGTTNKLVDKVIRKYTQNSSMVRSKMKDMNSLYWPISEAELKANPKLEQNPYYLTKVSN